MISIYKTFLVMIVFCAVLLYALDPNIFERVLFFNEIFPLIGFLIVVKNFQAIYNSDKITMSILVLIFYLTLFAIYSFFFIQNNLYMFLRHTVLIYSIFSFFIGFFIISKSFDYFKQYYNVISALLVTNFMMGFMFFRASAIITIPFMFLNRFYSKNVLHYGIVLSLFFATFYYEGSTQIACLLGFIYLIIIPTFRIFLLLSVPILALLIYIWIDIMSIMNADVLYLDLHRVFDNTLYSMDGNLLTRILLWYQLLVEHFPNNLYGIGFGNPIYDVNKVPLDPYPIRPWTLDTYNMLILETYLIGGHNSFLYLFTRTGIIPFSILMIIYYYIFKEYYSLREQLIQNKRVIFIYAFFIISISASLNVVLESPIHASLYWILMGAVVHSIIQTQKEKYEHFNHS